MTWKRSGGCSMSRSPGPGTFSLSAIARGAACTEACRPLHRAGSCPKYLRTAGWTRPRAGPRGIVSSPFSAEIPLPARDHLHHLEPRDAEQARGKCNCEVRWVHDGEMEKALQPGHVDHERQEAKGAPKDPEERGVAERKGCQHALLPASVGEDEAEIGDDQRDERKRAGLGHALPQGDGRRVDAD